MGKEEKMAEHGDGDERGRGGYRDGDGGVSTPPHEEKGELGYRVCGGKHRVTGRKA